MTAVLSIIIVALFVLLTVFVVSSLKRQQVIDTLKDELSNAGKDLETQVESFSLLDNKYSILEGQLEDLKVNYDKLSSEYADLTKRSADTLAEFDFQVQKFTDLKNDYQKLQACYKKHFRQDEESQFEIVEIEKEVPDGVPPYRKLERLSTKLKPFVNFSEGKVSILVAKKSE